METRLTYEEIADFSGYLKNCTDAQVRGVYEKERARGESGAPYAMLAKLEARTRGIGLE